MKQRYALASTASALTLGLCRNHTTPTLTRHIVQSPCTPLAIEVYSEKQTGTDTDRDGYRGLICVIETSDVDELAEYVEPEKAVAECREECRDAPLWTREVVRARSVEEDEVTE